MINLSSNIFSTTSDEKKLYSKVPAKKLKSLSEKHLAAYLRMSVAYFNYFRTIYEERWVRRLQRNHIRDICNPFELSDTEFQNIWRISKPMAFYVIERVRSDLEPKSMHGLPVHLKVLCSIQLLANGGYQRQIGQDRTMCLAQTTVSSFLDQFLASLYNRLFAEWVHFPGNEQARKHISAGFEREFNVPNVLGLVDCTHIKIFPPPGPQGVQYKNRRKSAHTINVQLIADADCRILSVNARYPGRVHDAFIWNNCAVRGEMKRLHNNRIGNYFLLGDSGYPLEPWLMTPVLHTEPDTPEQRYTDWHCRVRNAVERTNGYLKGSLRCLGIDRTLHYAPEKASLVIYAGCIIYTLMKHFGVELTENARTDPDEADDTSYSNHTPRQIVSLSQERRAAIIRNYFC